MMRLNQPVMRAADAALHTQPVGSSGDRSAATAPTIVASSTRLAKTGRDVVQTPGCSTTRWGTSDVPGSLQSGRKRRLSGFTAWATDLLP